MSSLFLVRYYLSLFFFILSIALNKNKIVNNKKNSVSNSENIVLKTLSRIANPKEKLDKIWVVGCSFFPNLKFSYHNRVPTLNSKIAEIILIIIIIIVMKATNKHHSLLF